MSDDKRRGYWCELMAIIYELPFWLRVMLAGAVALVFAGVLGLVDWLPER